MSGLIISLTFCFVAILLSILYFSWQFIFKHVLRQRSLLRKQQIKRSPSTTLTGLSPPSSAEHVNVIGPQPPFIVLSEKYPNWPIIGVVRQFMENPTEFLKKTYQTYGNVFSLPLFPFKQVTFLIGQDANQLFYSLDNEKSKIYNFYSPIDYVEDFNFTKERKEYLKQWNAVSNDFIKEGFLKEESLIKYIKNIKHEIRSFVFRQEHVDLDTVKMEFKKEELDVRTPPSFNINEEHQVIVINDLFSQITKFVIKSSLRNLMGNHIVEMHGNEIAEIMMHLEKHLSNPHIFMYYTYLQSNKWWKLIFSNNGWFVPEQVQRMELLKRRMHELFVTEMKRQHIYQTITHENRNTYIDMLFQKNGHDTYGSFTFDIYANHLIQILFEVHTHLTAIIAWTLAQIASDSTLQERIRGEILNFYRVIEREQHHHQAITTTQVSGRSSQYRLLYQEIEKSNSCKAPLKWLDSCLKETMRLYMINISFRKTNEPIVFQNFTIPSNQYIAVSPYLTHRLDKLFKGDFESYNPERFYNDQVDLSRLESEKNFGNYHSFLGDEFTQLTAKLLITELLSRFSLECPNMFPPCFESTGAFAVPKHPIAVLMYPLDASEDEDVIIIPGAEAL
ncbi:hypothetical protein ABK040_006456 [Willaertia magna]